MAVAKEANGVGYGLALHTASPDLGLAIAHTPEALRYQVWPLGREVSNYLQVYLTEFLAPQTWADLHYLAVARGPGGFTGTRLGVVTARTLAQQLEVPLFAVSTLAAAAWPHRRSAELIAIEMPAQRGAVFGAVYRVTSHGLVAEVPDAVWEPAAWQACPQQQAAHLVQAEGGLGESVVGVLELACLRYQAGERPHWSAALPFYGQHPVVS